MLRCGAMVTQLRPVSDQLISGQSLHFSAKELAEIKLNAVREYLVGQDVETSSVETIILDESVYAESFCHERDIQEAKD